MKKMILTIGLVISIGSIVYLTGADHIDAPAVGSLTTGSTVEDITDYYAFESPANSDNYVFVCNVSGLTAPSATNEVEFSENTMYEFNIDNDGDNLEDLVIQAYFKNGQVVTYGAVVPSTTGASSIIEKSGTKVSADITAYGETPVVGTAGGIQIFAGPRDDPFYMDFFKFVEIVNGVGASLSDETNTGLYDGDRDSDPDTEGIQPYPAAFDEPGADAFAGTNVLSVVIEVPKSSLGTSTTFTSWVESKTISQ